MYVLVVVAVSVWYLLTQVPFGRHLHFIDGADGGLFLAAKAFKSRATQFVSRTGV